MDDDKCYECTGYGDDYYLDDDGNLISACEGCPYNIASLASAPSGAQEALLTKIKAEVDALKEQIRKIEEMVYRLANNRKSEKED